MGAQSLQANMVTYGAAIKVCESNWMAALQILWDHHSLLDRNTVSWNTAISACERLGADFSNQQVGLELVSWWLTDLLCTVSSFFALDLNDCQCLSLVARFRSLMGETRQM